MISLFDAGFLHILFDPKARIPLGPNKTIIDRPQERIDFLVQTLTTRREKIILPTPALSEFMLLASDRWNEYLAILRRQSVFEIAGFDDAESVELVEQWLAEPGSKSQKRLKPGTPETWAKLKYDRQIVAIAATKRVTCIYTTDKDVRKLARAHDIESKSLADLPLPPPTQMELKESIQNEEHSEPTAAAIPAPTPVSGSPSGPAQGEAGAKASEANGVEHAKGATASQSQKEVVLELETPASTKPSGE